MRQVVIVGASAAGLTAAETLRRGGFPGRIVLIGAEAEAPYDRPPLSKRVLSGEWQPAQTALRSAADLAKLDLDLQLGVAADRLVADQQLVVASQCSWHYDALIIATGVRPRPLFELGERVHQLRTLADTQKLRHRLRPGGRLVIIGAGLIGAEVAAVARGLGVQVTMVEPHPAPLVPVAGRLLGGYLAELHRGQQVQLEAGVTAVGLSSGGEQVVSVELDDGRVLEADDVVVAVGSLPNTEWLLDSGLRLDDGIVCDQFCAASEAIYAAGDVARWHNPLFGRSMRVEHRTHAGEQAMAAARNLLRPPEEQVPFAPVPYFWSDQYHVKVQGYGHLRDHDEELLVHGDPDSGAAVVAFRRAETLVGVVSVGALAKQLRGWRQAVAAKMAWEHALAELAQN